MSEQRGRGSRVAALPAFTEEDKEFFRKRVAHAIDQGNWFAARKYMKQLNLMDDAVHVYRKYPQIPDSLLIPNFMRKLQDGLDRRRP